MVVENDLFFSLLIESNSFFVSGNRNRLDIRVAIEIDLISVMGSKWGMEADSFLWGIEIGLFVRGPNCFGYVRADNGLVFVCRPKLTWF